MKIDIGRVDAKVDKLEIKIENEVSRKIGSLYEGQGMINNRLDTMESKIDEISDKHEIKIQYIEGCQKRKTI